MTEKNEAEKLAMLFHDTYERLAPEFGYRTRPASAVTWEVVPESNKRLMIATAEVVLASLSPQVEGVVEWGNEFIMQPYTYAEYPSEQVARSYVDMFPAYRRLVSRTRTVTPWKPEETA